MFFILRVTCDHGLDYDDINLFENSSNKINCIMKYFLKMKCSSPLKPREHKPGAVYLQAIVVFVKMEKKQEFVEPMFFNNDNVSKSRRGSNPNYTYSK